MANKQRIKRIEELTNLLENKFDYSSETRDADTFRNIRNNWRYLTDVSVGEERHKRNLSKFYDDTEHTQGMKEINKFREKRYNTLAKKYEADGDIRSFELLQKIRMNADYVRFSPDYELRRQSSLTRFGYKSERSLGSGHSRLK